ncbi:MAG: hypothetical protein M3P08_18730 [Thermoproteota archaeon]|nr:hypothetical protein [Thermoproteota archaeon]
MISSERDLRLMEELQTKKLRWYPKYQSKSSRLFSKSNNGCCSKYRNNLSGFLEEDKDGRSDTCTDLFLQEI